MSVISNYLPASHHQSHSKLPGPVAQKLWVKPGRIVHGKKWYGGHLSQTHFGLRMVTCDRKKHYFLFVPHAGRGLFWSHRLAVMFGTLTKYSFVIYWSIFMRFGAFLKEKNILSNCPCHFELNCEMTPQFLLKSAKNLKLIQNLAKRFVKMTSTIHKQSINKIPPAPCSYCILHLVAVVF